MLFLKFILFLLQPEISKISFALVGDIAISPTQEDSFSQVTSFLKAADLCIGNLEGVICNKKNLARKKGNRSYNFKMSPSFAPILKKAGFNILNIANNHSLDYGKIGLTETIEYLQKENLLISGRKNQPVKINLYGKSIWIVGFSTYEYHNSVLDISQQTRWIKELKNQCDLLIVTFHAGAEGDAHTNVPKKIEYSFGEVRGNVFTFAHNAIDHGADLVFGHGPHVLRGIEIYKNRLIAYSLGNFAGKGYLSTSGIKYLSTILLITIGEKGDFIKGKIIPISLLPEGLPHLDSQKKSISLINSLSKKDFPNTHPKINPNGDFFKNNL